MSTIRVLKERDLGYTGVADNVVYIPETGRMVAVTGEIQAAFKGKGKSKGNYENNDF